MDADIRSSDSGKTDLLDSRLERLYYSAKRFAIRTLRIATGCAVALYGIEVFGDAQHLSNIQFSHLSTSSLLKMIGLFIFSVYLIFLSFKIAFGAGPSDR